MLGLSGVPAAIQLVGFHFLPETPRWLLRHGRRNDAKKSLFRTRGVSPPPNDASNGRGGDTRGESGEWVGGEEVEEVEEEWRQLVSRVAQSDESKSLLHGVEGGVDDGALNIDLGEGGEESGGGRRSSIVLEHPWQDKAVRRALLVGCVLQFIQQVAGINTVMYYSATILQTAGFPDNEAIWLAAAVAFTNFAFTLLELYLVERTGRRRLTLGSLGGVVAALALLAGVFFARDKLSPQATLSPSPPSSSSCSEWRTCVECVLSDTCGFWGTDSNGACLAGNATSPHDAISSIPGAWHFRECPGVWQGRLAWMAFASIIVYLMCFAPGMGGMPWTVNSEIYPLSVRSRAVGIATMVNWGTNLVISLTFLSLVRAVTAWGAFILYAAVAAGGWIFLFFRLPETRGKTLEEIRELFLG